MASVSTARVLILGADDVEDMELLYPLFRLREEEAPRATVEQLHAQARRLESLRD